MGSIVIDGFTPDDKVPGFVAQIRPGTGKLSVGQIPLWCTLIGNPTSTGAAAAANSMTVVTTPEEAATAWGARSELARQAYAALDVPGVTLRGIAVPEPSGGTAASLTMTVTGTFAAAGTVWFQLDEEIFPVNFAASDNTVTLAAVAIVAKVNALQNGRLYCTAQNTAGVVTLTVANLGVRGNQHTCWVVDKSKAPGTMAIALAGGSALSNGGVPFSAGAGADDISTGVTPFDAISLDYVASAANDATNAGVLETHLNAKAAFDVGIYDQYVVSGNGIQSAAIAIGQTQMNDTIGQFVWNVLGVEHPSRIAARVAALRSVTEGGQPNTNYDDMVLPGAAPHYQVQDSPSRAVKKAALNAGITPLATIGGKLTIVRSINSHSLNGTTPDYRTLDSADTSVPIRIVKELRAEYYDMKTKNPWSGPDVGDAMPPAGTFSPKMWGSRVTALMKLWEGPDFNWVTAVDDNPTVAVWDNVGKRVMSATPSITKPQNHQVGVVVNQQAA